MKLFISWSGQRSQILAESLGNWIPKVINAVEPWLSAKDIDPGSRWSPEIANQLEQTKFGVICLTSDNLSSPWIHFEAGALSKLVDKSKVVPLLLDNNPVDIKGPLAQFQAIIVNKEDIKKLMNALNVAVSSAGEKGIDKTMLEEAFDVWWPKLDINFKDIPKSITKLEESKRTEREMIEEILGLVRGITRDTTWEDIRFILPLIDSPLLDKSSDEYKRYLTRLINIFWHERKMPIKNIDILSWLHDAAEGSTTKSSTTKVLGETSNVKEDKNPDNDNLILNPEPSSK